MKKIRLVATPQESWRFSKTTAVHPLCCCTNGNNAESANNAGFFIMTDKDGRICIYSKQQKKQAKMCIRERKCGG